MTGQRFCFFALVLGASLMPPLHAQSRNAPLPEVQRAERAVGDALRAQADVHARNELELAQTLLDEARDLESRRKRRDAQGVAVRAELEARLAEAMAGHNRLRGEVRARSDDNARLRRELLDGGLQ
jgi:hypothetical protein